MYPPITYQLLISKFACTRQLELVRKHFGIKPIPLTDKVIEKFSSMFDIHWAASHLLTQVDLLEYKKVTDPAMAEYNKVKDLAYSEYKKVVNHDLAEYKKVVNHDLAEYNKVEERALAKYKKVRDPAFAEYKKVTAKEFVQLYQKGM